MAQNYYLMHHGVKGMKWGVRKTPEQLGYRRSSRASGSFQDTVKKATTPTIKRGKGKENITPAEKIASDGRKITDELSTMSNRASKNRSRKGNNASKMSDAELRQAINRLNMEKQYDELLQSRNTSRGKETVDNILAYTGSILAIAGAGLSIYTTIKGMK